MQTRRVPPRDKRIRFEPAQLPKIDRAKQYSAAEIVTAAMKVFARDPAVVSIDADLASTSGLEAGVAAVDQRRALNVGVAEANMLCIGEGYAIQGFNAWVSTFCPFFDWKVMRRVAVGHQERLEAIAAADGWLSEGHGLDLTMLATAANFETRTNGATHMGNDDNTIFDGLAHLKIVDVVVPAADARHHALDHGGQPRTRLPAGHAHAVGGALSRRLRVRVRQGGGAVPTRRRPRRSSSAAAAASTRHWRQPRHAPRAASPSASSTCRRSTKTCWSSCAGPDG